MAITWELEITPIDVETQAVSVTATRTDDTLPDESKVYRVDHAVIVTAAQKTAVLDNIWNQHQNAITKQAQIDAFLGTLAANGKADLEARE